MTGVVVAGTQWGDEGKGKVVDWLAARADLVVRFQGGHNAGHTLVTGGTVYRLSLLPSGIVRGKPSLLGSGIVLDPWAFLEEVRTVREQSVKITPDILGISHLVSLILPFHREIDRLREAGPGRERLGTTQRGIGPAYEDRVGRRALRLYEIFRPELMEARIRALLFHHNALRRGHGVPELDAGELVREIGLVAPQLRPYMVDTGARLDASRREGRRILFEGAQGALLDVDHGTYPFVTSSHTLAAQAAIGAPVRGRSLGYVLGIMKAYTTRVGEGPFPSEQDNDIGESLGRRGGEFGTVTGRKRRCGWFDAALLRPVMRIGGYDGVALTKLDVLDGFPEIRICTGYRFRGRVVESWPPEAPEQELEPVYEIMPGWNETTRGARSWADLPAGAVKYIRRIEELTGVPVAMVSTSPEREDVILVRHPFEDD